MDKQEALFLLNRKLDEYRQRSFSELVEIVGKNQQHDAIGCSGVEYQIEVVVLWDSKPGRDIRLLGAIDDGGWRAFVPLCADLLVSCGDNGSARPKGERSQKPT